MINRRKGRNLPGAVLLLGLGYLFLIMAAPAQAEERILSFHSDIKINSDASLTVTETITVRAENDQIKRGIYRDFPTRYRGKIGLTRRVGFQVRQVLRDGEPESFHFEGMPMGSGSISAEKKSSSLPGNIPIPSSMTLIGSSAFSRSLMSCTGTLPATTGTSLSLRPRPWCICRKGPAGRWSPLQPTPA